MGEEAETCVVVAMGLFVCRSWKSLHQGIYVSISRQSVLADAAVFQTESLLYQEDAVITHLHLRINNKAEKNHCVSSKFE